MTFWESGTFARKITKNRDIEVTCPFGLYNGSNGHGGGFSSGVLLVFFWVLLGSSGVLLCYRTPEEHQKNTRRNARRTQKNPEGEEHQPPLVKD